MALAASASAFAPAAFGARKMMSLNNVKEMGKYDGQMYDNEAKKDLYAAWDPSSPRTTQNFNPFETYKGNSGDASGIFPGESFYKDPIRPDVSFAIMMAERGEADIRAANPKAGEVPGCPGCVQN